MLLYILGCIFCAQSESISPFLIGRFLQALGACAALVSWQPMLIQIFPPIKASSMGSLLFILMCLSPGAAPIIGAYSASLFSWKICFHFLAGYAILLSILVYFYAPQFKKVTSKDSYSLFMTFKALFSNKTYMKLLLLISSCNSGYLTYLVAYPLLVSSNTNEAVELGLQFIPIAISFSFGAILGKKLIQKNESYKIIQHGILLYLISVGILLLTLTFAVITNPWLQILPSFCLLVFANGLLLPVASMEAILASGSSTYSASGLIGASRMLIAFIATSLLSFSSQYSLSTGLLGILILTSFVNFKYSLKERT